MTPYVSHPLARGVRPNWASCYGQDEFGVWAGFTVAGVDYRLRWIPSGTFLMGSPEDELGRHNNETQHPVTVDGLWLAEALCTQQLWEVVMGKNPSRFQSSTRPVEQVSWEDCQEFLEKTETLHPGLALRLPTEAEWEYACLAGTTTATYAGNLELLGPNNAPVLDAISWYSGNIGIQYDLDEGEFISSGEDRQYMFDKGGTRSVMTKTPNSWGLYDMLGNVAEWCSDGYPLPFVKRMLPPDMVGKIALRGTRGGSWFNYAGCLRAAYASTKPPDIRHASLGFRVSRSQV